MSIEEHLEKAELIRDDLEAAKNDVSRSEADLDHAEGQVDAAHRRLDRASPDDPDYEDLRAQLTLSEEKAEDARARLSQARTELSAAQGRRDNEVAQISQYLNQSSAAIDQLGRAASVTSYGRGANTAAQDSIRKTIATGQQALSALDADWSGRHAGGNLAVSSGLSAFAPAAVGSEGIQHALPDDQMAGVGQTEEPDPSGVEALVDDMRTRLREAMGPVREKSLLHEGGRVERWPDPDAFRPILDGIPGTDSVVASLQEAHENEVAAYLQARNEAKEASVSVSTPATEATKSITGGADTVQHELNGHAGASASSACDMMLSQYLSGATEHSEALSRKVEMLRDERAKLDKLVNNKRSELDGIERAIGQFSQSHDAQSLTVDEAMQLLDLRARQLLDLRARQKDGLEGLLRTEARRGELEREMSSLRANLAPANETRFVGMGGAGFLSAYDSFITDRQGTARSDVLGCCGVGGAYSMVNRQTGSAYDWHEAINACLGAKPPTMLYVRGEPYRSGGTSYDDRRKIYESYGLNSEWTQTGRGAPNQITVEGIANSILSGRSVGLSVKGRDLQLMDISRNKSVPSGYSADHMVTVAGFSVDSSGSVTGLWLNDTGGFTVSNRIFVSREKFNMMQDCTDGFAAEYVWKESRD